MNKSNHIPFEKIDVDRVLARTKRKDGSIMKSMIYLCPKSLLEPEKSERLDIVDKIKIKGLFNKKILVYGRNKDYDSIKILHDYNNGRVLDQLYFIF